MLYHTSHDFGINICRVNNTHAIILNKSGKTQDAVDFWKKSSQLNKPYSAYANLSLARFYLHMGRVDRAIMYLNKILPDSFAAAQKYEMTGDIYLRQKSYHAAIAAYEKSLGINSALLSPRRKLIDLYQKTDPSKANEARDMLAYISSFY